MARSRFYLSPAEWNLEDLSLGGEEAHHCLDVMRCREGDRVVVFNGAGTEAEAEILSAGRGEVKLKPLLVNETGAPPATLVLAQAVPKGKHMDLIVQKATELGAARIVPLLSERTVVQVGRDELEKKRAKWQRVAVEACKQCGQNWLPEVEAPLDVAEYVKRPRAELKLVAAISPTARPLKAVLADWCDEHGQLPGSAEIMVGPEGDFTPAEVSTALAAGFAPISLGPIILRSETAAIYVLSIAGHELMAPSADA